MCVGLHSSRTSLFLRPSQRSVSRGNRRGVHFWVTASPLAGAMFIAHGLHQGSGETGSQARMASRVPMIPMNRWFPWENQIIVARIGGTAPSRPFASPLPGTKHPFSDMIAYLHTEFNHFGSTATLHVVWRIVCAFSSKAESRACCLHFPAIAKPGTNDARYWVGRCSMSLSRRTHLRRHGTPRQRRGHEAHHGCS